MRFNTLLQPKRVSTVAAILLIAAASVVPASYASVAGMFARSSSSTTARRTQEVIAIDIRTDTIWPQYGIRTDSILALGTAVDASTGALKSIVVARRCGVSRFFLRIGRYGGGKTAWYYNGDSVTVNVTGCTTPTGSTPAPYVLTADAMKGQPTCWDTTYLRATKFISDTTYIASRHPLARPGCTLDTTKKQ